MPRLLGLETQEPCEASMDLIFLAVIVGFFVLTGWLVSAVGNL